MKLTHCFADLVTIEGCPVEVFTKKCTATGVVKTGSSLTEIYATSGAVYQFVSGVLVEDEAAMLANLQLLGIGHFSYGWDGVLQTFELVYEGNLPLAFVVINGSKVVFKCETLTTVRSPYPIKVNDLPQISAEMVMEIADADMDSYVELFNKISNYAWELFRQYLMEALLKKQGVFFEHILYQSERPQLHEPLTLSTLYFPVVGQQIRVYQAKYVQYYLRGVWVASPDRGATVRLLILDLTTGQLIQSIDSVLSTDSDLSYLSIDKAIVSEQSELNFGVFVDTATTPVALYNLWCGGLLSDCGCSSKRGQEISLSVGLDPALLMKQENVKYFADGSFGVCLDGELLCSVEAFICQNKYHFAFAFRLLLGSLYFQKARVPDGNLHFWKMMPPEVLKEFEDELMKQFMRSLHATVERLPLSGLCLNCKAEKKGGYSILSNV